MFYSLIIPAPRADSFAGVLPARFFDPGNQPLPGQFSETDTAQAESSQVSPGSAADITTVIPARRKLRSALPTVDL